MFKLLILIEPEIDSETFFQGWPKFLSHAEEMPGLEKLVTAPVHEHLSGQYSPLMVHELHFEDRSVLEKALASPAGIAAGKTLQQITGGHVSLLIAAHLEDSGEHLRDLRSKKAPSTKG